MNYYLLRIIILVTITLIILLLNKFIFKKNLKDSRFLSIYAVVILSIIVLPYDKLLFKFNSIEKLFNYYYPKVDVLEKYEYKDYAYVLYHEDNSYSFVNLKKDDNKWNLKNSIFTQGRGKVENGYIFAINEIKDKNVIGIFILTLGEEIDVTDTLGTKFKETKNETSIYYIAIIENYDDNYKVIINDEEYKVLE